MYFTVNYCKKKKSFESKYNLGIHIGSTLERSRSLVISAERASQTNISSITSEFILERSHTRVIDVGKATHKQTCLKNHMRIHREAT